MPPRPRPRPEFPPRRAVGFAPRPAAQAPALADLAAFQQITQALTNLSHDIAQVRADQAEARRPQLTKPLLAAVDGILPDLGVSTDQLEQFRRCLRLADGLQDSDQVVAAALPGLWQQVRLHPGFADNQLLSIVRDNLPVGRPVSLLQPVAARGLAGAPLLSAVRQPAAGASPLGGTACFRCGRYDHDRAQDCQETTTRTGETILPGQQCRFAPAHWKARYGFNSQGFPNRSKAPEGDK